MRLKRDELKELTTSLIVSDPPFLPAIRIEHPRSLDIAPISNEFMLHGDGSANCSADSPVFSISIKQFTARKNRPHQGLFIPKLIRATKSSLLFDLARIRWSSPYVSELLIDSRINTERTYFINVIRPLINLAACTQSSVLLHAALTQWKDTGVLMPGNSGDGKTTLAILSAFQGHKVVTDDLSLIAPHNNKLFGKALRDHIYVRRATFKHIPKNFKSDAVEGMFLTEKKHTLLRENLAEFTLDTCEINVILFPQISNHKPYNQAYQIHTLSKTDALVRLLKSIDPLLMKMMDESSRFRTIDTLRTLVKKCVCLSLTTTPLLLQNPESHITNLVSEVLKRYSACKNSSCE